MADNKYENDTFNPSGQALRMHGWRRTIDNFEVKLAEIDGLWEAINSFPSLRNRYCVREEERSSDSWAHPDHDGSTITYHHDGPGGGTFVTHLTNAMYRCTYSPECGVIVAHNSSAPWYTIETNSLNCLPPKLKHWCDVVALAWSKEVDKDERPLAPMQHIFQVGITNDITEMVMKKVLVAAYGHVDKAEGFRRSGWARKLTFVMHTNEAKALLASPYGTGVAWLLLRYRDVFGWKRVKCISMFGMGDCKATTLALGNLHFELEDVPEAERPKGWRDSRERFKAALGRWRKKASFLQT